MKKSRLMVQCLLSMIFIFSTSACTSRETENMISYDGSVKNISYMHFVTGENSFNKTDEYTVGGCDLGFQCYNRTNNTMYLFFGDTFTSALQSGRWRSNVIARSSDFNLSDGFSIDDFIASSSGIAKPAIEGHHVDFYEMTKIPTGAIEIDGTMYMFYFSKYSWNVDNAQSMNYGGAIKSTDNGLSWERVYDLTWVDHATGDRVDDIQTLVNENVDLQPDCGNVALERHEAYDFTQIFPVDGKDGYIYMYGEGGYRSQGLKLARVKIESIELFDEYEYFIRYNESNQPVWIKGREGLDAMKDNNESFLIKTSTFGEMSAVYNKYLQKWMLFTCNTTSEYGSAVVYYVADTPYGPFGNPICLIPNTSELLPQSSIYAPLTNEMWQEENGRVFYLLLSTWMPSYNPSLYKIELS